MLEWDWTRLWMESMDEATALVRDARDHAMLLQILLAGIVLIAGGLFIAWLRSPTPEPTAARRWKQVAWSAALSLLGVGCLLYGVVLTSMEGRRPTARRPLRPVCTPLQGFQRLEAGVPVRRAIRLIAYDPIKEPQLAATKLTMLGVPHEKFIFVADYDELAGCTAAQALYKIGREVPKGSRVSAIIYPIGDRTIFSANARGVLRAVRAVDREQSAKGAAKDYKPADLSRILSPRELAGLDEPIAQSWAWKSYNPLMDAYTKAVRKLQAEKCSAFDYIGLIDRDWNSLGYAKVIADVQMQPDDFSLTVDGRSIPVENFGARVFLTANAAIADLDDVCILQFADPLLERIPDLGPPSGNQRPGVEKP